MASKANPSWARRGQSLTSYDRTENVMPDTLPHLLVVPMPRSSSEGLDKAMLTNVALSNLHTGQHRMLRSKIHGKNRVDDPHLTKDQLISAFEPQTLTMACGCVK